jgi:hypothetical protein
MYWTATWISLAMASFNLSNNFADAFTTDGFFAAMVSLLQICSYI